ncbi:MAG: hypothetical protein R6V57_12330 [Vicinamibacterales bacterium]
MPSARRARVPIMLLSVLPFFASCAGNDQPGSSALTGPTASTAAAVATGVSTAMNSERCYSVQFLASAPNGPGNVTLTLSGDLAGTLAIGFDPATIKYSGPMPMFSGGTMSIEGTGTWVITGGIVPGLSSFQTSFTNRNLLSAVAGSTSEVFENIGSHRATLGVGKANLEYKGTAQPAGIEHRYHGVICP